MPFDGLDPDRTFDPSAAIDAMVDFYDGRPMSWCSGTLCIGNPKAPPVLCMRGALNYVAYQNATPGLFAGLKLFCTHPHSRTWRSVNRALHQASKLKYNRKSYVYANDHYFKTQRDAVELLTLARQFV